MNKRTKKSKSSACVIASGCDPMSKDDWSGFTGHYRVIDLRDSNGARSFVVEFQRTNKLGETVWMEDNLQTEWISDILTSLIGALVDSNGVSLPITV